MPGHTLAVWSGRAWPFASVVAFVLVAPSPRKQASSEWFVVLAVWFAVITYVVARCQSKFGCRMGPMGIVADEGAGVKKVGSRSLLHPSCARLVPIKIVVLERSMA